MGAYPPIFEPPDLIEWWQLSFNVYCLLSLTRYFFVAAKVLCSKQRVATILLSNVHPKKRLIRVLPTTSVSVPRNLNIRVAIYHSSSQVTKRSGYFLLSSLLCCSSWLSPQDQHRILHSPFISRTQCSSSFLHDLQLSLSSDVDPLSLHNFYQ